MQREPTVDDLRVKLCYICREEERHDNPPHPPPVWTHPCKCTLVAHESCLLHWIKTQQHDQGHTRGDLKCPQCGDYYEFEGFNPPSLRLLNALNRSLSRCGGVVTICCAGTIVISLGAGLYLTCASYGAFAVREFIGPDLFQILISNDPAKWPWQAWVNLPLIPFSLIASRTPLVLWTSPLVPLLLPWPSTIPIGSTSLHSSTSSRLFSSSSSARIAAPLWPPHPAIVCALFPAVRAMYKRLRKHVTNAVVKPQETRAQQPAAAGAGQQLQLPLPPHEAAAGLGPGRLPAGRRREGLQEWLQRRRQQRQQQQQQEEQQRQEQQRAGVPGEEGHLELNVGPHFALEIRALLRLGLGGPAAGDPAPPVAPAANNAPLALPAAPVAAPAPAPVPAPDVDPNAPVVLAVDAGAAGANVEADAVENPDHRQQQQQQQPRAEEAQGPPLREQVPQLQPQQGQEQRQEQDQQRDAAPQWDDNDLAAAAARTIQLTGSSLGRLLGGALAMPTIARVMGCILLRLSHVLPLVRAIIAPRPFHQFPPAAGGGGGGFLGLWTSTTSRLRLFAGGGAVAVAGGLPGGLSARVLNVLFLATSQEWATSDPVWWRNVLGLGIFVVLKDGLKILHLRLAKRELEERHIKNKSFSGVDLAALDLIDRSG